MHETERVQRRLARAQPDDNRALLSGGGQVLVGDALPFQQEVANVARLLDMRELLVVRVGVELDGPVSCRGGRQRDPRRQRFLGRVEACVS